MCVRGDGAVWGGGGFKCKQIFSSVLVLKWMDGRLAILRLLNSFSVISGRWAGDNERLRANKPRFRLSSPRVGLKLGTAS